MIYVALGTQDKEFKRLIDIVKNFLEETNSEEEIIIQYGNTKYDYSFFDNFPNVKYFDFISPDVFDKYMIEADVVVTHAGVGTIINGLKKNKKLIVVPRLKKYKEHVNDHQLQITENFAKEGYIIELKDDEKLQDALEKAKVFQPNKYISNHDRFNDELEKIINK